MSELHVFDHPLIQHKLSILRDKNTSVKEFRELVGEIAMLMCYEATRDLPLEEVEIETPVAKATVKRLAGKKLAIVPILRAGLGMVDGMVAMIPSCKVGHIGLYRDPETLEPVEYYCKLPPDVSERDVIVVDPMFATGGSASAACTFLKQHGCRHIKLMCIIGAPPAWEKMQKGSSGRRCLRRRHGPDPERSRLHRPRSRRRRRPYFRHEVREKDKARIGSNARPF